MRPVSGTPILNERGVSVVEVMVALVMFAVTVLGLASMGYGATHTLRSARNFGLSATVAESKLDSVTALGWAALAGEYGADTVQGLPVNWNVQGTNPRIITLIVQRPVGLQFRPDSFVTYVAEP